MDGMEHQPTLLANALQKQCSRVARWMVVSFLLAIAASILAAATKSIAFLAVALFAWFFAWNRWKLRRFLVAFLPPPAENAHLWCEKATKALQNPPAWYRYSEYIALVTFFAIAAAETIVVASTSGTWMRLLYVACWAVSLAVVLARVRNVRRKAPENRLAR